MKITEIFIILKVLISLNTIQKLIKYKIQAVRIIILIHLINKCRETENNIWVFQELWFLRDKEKLIKRWLTVEVVVH